MLSLERTIQLYSLAHVHFSQIYYLSSCFQSWIKIYKLFQYLPYQKRIWANLKIFQCYASIFQKLGSSLLDYASRFFKFQRTLSTPNSALAFSLCTFAYQSFLASVGKTKLLTSFDADKISSNLRVLAKRLSLLRGVLSCWLRGANVKAWSKM